MIEYLDEVKMMITMEKSKMFIWREDTFPLSIRRNGSR